MALLESDKDLDAATIISILPWKLFEQKPGVFPGRFYVDAAEDDDFTVTHIGESVAYVVTDHDSNPPQTVPVHQSPLKMANSIVKDYSEAQLAYGEDCRPGLLVVKNKLSKAEVEAKHSTELKLLRAQQIQWFRRLVELADDMWNQTHAHRSITDIQRFAASYLKMERPWNLDIETINSTIKCPACTQYISADAMICHFCRTVVKPEEYVQFSRSNETPAGRSSLGEINQ